MSNAAGYAIGGAIQPVLEPATMEIANQAWSARPNRPLPASQAAQLVHHGLADLGLAAEEAARTGINGERFDQLVELVANTPALATLLDLRRRGLIDDAGFRNGLAHDNVPAAWRDDLLALVHITPSVTDMIHFAVREVYDPAQRDALDLDAEFPAAFAADAETIGISRDLAGKHWAAHWDLPSFEQAVEMLHRGIIDQGTFNGLLRALDYAPTWRDRLRRMSERIPPISDMIRFAVREAYDDQQAAALGLDADFPAEFATEAALHGMNRERAEQYWRAHWRMPSAQQGYRMLHRGLITEPQLEALLRALDYPSVWRDRLRDIAYLVPGRVDLRRMFAAGVVDRAYVLAGYQRLGYTAADAEILTDFAVSSAAGGEGAKQNTASEMLLEYETGFITEAQLREGLGALGYAGPALEREVNVSYARAVRTERARLVTALHRLYVARRMTEAQARERLASAGYADDATERIMPLWNAERDAAAPTLTAAQVRAAWRKGQYTEAEALDELDERGYTPDEARRFLRG